MSQDVSRQDTSSLDTPSQFNTQTVVSYLTDILAFTFFALTAKIILFGYRPLLYALKERVDNAIRNTLACLIA